MTRYKEEGDRTLVHQVTDEEMVTPGDLRNKGYGLDNSEKNVADILKSETSSHADIFSWKNIEYEVPISGKEMRKLLDDVSGYVAPGKLTALMGESGAGKVVWDPVCRWYGC